MCSSLKTNVRSNPSEYLQTLSLSEKRFQEILKDMGFQSEEVSEEMLGRKLVKLLSLRISHEIFRTSFQEIVDEKELPRKALELDFDIADDIF
jgi:hypothetical protein